MVICHIDPPGKSGRRVEEGERKREREEERGRERERETDKKKRRESELGTLLTYTPPTLYIYFYICMLLNSVYKVRSIFKKHIHTREALLLPMLK